MADDRDQVAKTSRRSRRSFSRRRLLEGGAGLGGAAAAVAGVAGAARAADDPVPPEDDPMRVRYRETEHIRAFYRRSRM
ncbi:MAG TPA: hypothetical protein VFZ01_14055 [Geminicoccaceae bacterium]